MSQPYGQKLGNMNQFGGGGTKFNKDQIQEGLKSHFTNKVMVVDDVDKQVWDLIS